MHFCDHQDKQCGFNKRSMGPIPEYEDQPNVSRRSMGHPSIGPIPEYQRDTSPPLQRPLARILERVRAHVPPRENIYTSLSSDYKSLQNHESLDRIECAGDNTPMPCSLLLDHLLSSHSDTSHHAHKTGCLDCQDYATSLDTALPRLFPQGLPTRVYGHVHYVSTSYSFIYQG